MYNWKARYSFVFFLQIMWKIIVFGIIKKAVWLKLLYLPKLRKAFISQNLFYSLKFSLKIYSPPCLFCNRYYHYYDYHLHITVIIIIITIIIIIIVIIIFIAITIGLCVLYLYNVCIAYIRYCKRLIYSNDGISSYKGLRYIPWFNTLRPRQNGRHFADDTFNRIVVNENVRILIKFSLKFVPKGPINNNPAFG